MADVPDRPRAAMVSVVRPRRSASAPARMQPSPPEATTANAARLAVPASVAPVRASEAARNTGIQLHIAYSSHMWPR